MQRNRKRLAFSAWLGLLSLAFAGCAASQSDSDALRPLDAERQVAMSGARGGMGGGMMGGGMMGGTSSPGLGAGSAQPMSADAFDGALAPDLSPLADVVEVSLEARAAEVAIGDGRVVTMWTYNGVVPGPRIEARVGDLLRVRFHNALSQPTTIHWHGLRVPAAMDGAGMMMDPIAPGGSFTYEFRLPDAGTFWYHPHVHADEQVGRGLFGTLVVRGAEEPATHSDRVVALHDVLLGSDGQIAAPGMMATMTGREGNVLLVNGHVLPTAQVAAGGLHRLRLVNTAAARYFKVAIPGSSWLLIGHDGGRLERARSVADVLLAPGQRADVLVRVEGPVGQTLPVQSQPYDRGSMRMGGGMMGGGMMGGARTRAQVSVDLFALQLTAAASPIAPPSTFSAIEALPVPSVRRALRLQALMGGMRGQGGMMGMSFAINGEVYPDVTPLHAQLGDIEEWTIVNETAMDHPFHLHGVRFQVVSESGVAPAYRAWQDTINVRARQTSIFRVRLDSPGMWMFHCHILSHEEHGMAGEVDVMEGS